MIHDAETREGCAIKQDTQSFIVKIWLEETAEEAGSARWRGHITHVPGGEKRYVESLTDIGLFIAPYLRAMNAPIGISWTFRRWLRRPK